MPLVVIDDWLEQSDNGLICGGYVDVQRELGIIAMIQMVRSLSHPLLSLKTQRAHFEIVYWQYSLFSSQFTVRSSIKPSTSPLQFTE